MTPTKLPGSNLVLISKVLGYSGVQALVCWIFHLWRRRKAQGSIDRHVFDPYLNICCLIVSVCEVETCLDLKTDRKLKIHLSHRADRIVRASMDHS